MPVVSSQMDLLEQPLLYTQVGMVSLSPPATPLISESQCKSAGLDTRHSLTYNERAHKQNIIYGCATAMIYLFNIALNTIEVLKSIKG